MAAIIEARVEKLSDGQRECLRRVYDHKTSKTIARELDISPHTVDQRIKVAMRQLKVDSRVDAARILMEHERPGSHHKLVYQAPDIESEVLDKPRSSVVAESGSVGDPAGHVEEEERAFNANYALQAMPGGPASLPLEWRQRRELTPWQKLGAIALIAIGSALSFGAVLAGLDALTRLS